MTWSKFVAKGPAVRSGLSMALIGLAAVHFWPASAAAQAPGTGFATAYQGNAGKPVDIEAEMLEVDDRKKIAVFRGNVSATQGDMNLRSQEIHVTYSSSGNKTASAASNDAAPNPLGGGGEITQIDAKGNVTVTMKPKNPADGLQKATGDTAIFDVKKQVVTMSGNVVLSQGKNIMQGSRLVVDLASGRSTFENSGNAGGTGKVRFSFTPPSKDKSKEKPKEEAAQ